MRYRAVRPPRRGAVILEAALVYPMVFLILLGLIVCGFGVFRFQEVASLSREASRYAAVHGSKYHQVTGKLILEQPAKV